jgi:hypothetical protein
MVRIKRSYRIQVCGTKMCPLASSPRIPNRPTGTDQTPRYAKAPSRSSSSLRVLRRQGAAKHKPAGRQAAKLCYRFGPLTPSARSANLIAGDGTKNGFPAPNKEPAKTKNDYLTGKAPYRFESISLLQGVCEPSVPKRRCRSRTASFAQMCAARWATFRARLFLLDSH